MGVTTVKEKIFMEFCGDFPSNRILNHGHTFTGNQLGCAAALVNLELMERKSFIKEVAEKSVILQELLDPLIAHPHVSEIRLRGLMGGIELVKNKKTNEPYPYQLKMGYKVCAEAKKQGVLLRPLGNVIVLMPPLGITKGDLGFLIEVISTSIQKATGVRF